MATASYSPTREEPSNFFAKFSNAFRKLVGSYAGQIKTGRTALEMPTIALAPLQKSVMGCSTGPLGGLCQLDPELDAPTHDHNEPLAGVTHWFRPQPQADGESITLYEHKHNSAEHHGDPIADVYAIVARPNSCILAVADGVNWGIKPRLAARCAIHGCVDHLNSKVFDCPKTPGTTQDVFHNILRSFHSAQKLIIKRGGTTTTLCVAVVVELLEPKAGCKWGLCVVSVGDTLCYVWRNEEREVYEVTSAMHSGQERNPRDSGGCLGCDLGDQPDLSNLLCCFVPLSEGDVVFAVTDGISDNIDPVILKEAITPTQHKLSTSNAPPPPLTPTTVTTPAPILTSTLQGPPILPPPVVSQPDGGGGDSSPPLPVVTPEQRQTLSLMRLRRMLREKQEQNGGGKKGLNATDIKDAIVNHVIEATEDKRGFLERCWAELDKPDLTPAEKRANDRKIGQHIKLMPGKLDHATIAAYQVGRMYSAAEVMGEPGRPYRSPTHSHVMNSAIDRNASAASTKRTQSCSAGGSVFYSRPIASKSSQGSTDTTGQFGTPSKPPGIVYQI